MPPDTSEPFRTSRRRRGSEAYEFLSRFGYHLETIVSDDRIDRPVEAEYEFDALGATLSDIFDAFDVHNESARTLLRRALEDTNMNSRVGLELELHIGRDREGLELTSTELVSNGSVFSIRDRDSARTRAQESIALFREEMTEARTSRESVRIHIQRKHHRIRFKWETFDRANEAVLTTDGGVLSRIRRVVG